MSDKQAHCFGCMQNLAVSTPLLDHCKQHNYHKSSTMHKSCTLLLICRSCSSITRSLYLTDKLPCILLYAPLIKITVIISITNKVVTSHIVTSLVISSSTLSPHANNVDVPLSLVVSSQAVTWNVKLRYLMCNYI